MRILVSGTRHANEAHRTEVYELLSKYTDAVRVKRPSEEITVVYGAAPGVDWIAHEWAVEHGHTAEPHAAQWGKYGKTAGPLRNQEMVNTGATLALAFPAAGSQGKGGTWDLIHRAADAGMSIHVNPLKVG